jgi:hypothetical protein
MKEKKSICAFKIKQPNYFRQLVVTQREYFLDDGYGYSAIISILERGRQKKKMVALKGERLSEEKSSPYGECYISWRHMGCIVLSFYYFLFLLYERKT